MLYLRTIVLTSLFLGFLGCGSTPASVTSPLSEIDSSVSELQIIGATMTPNPAHVNELVTFSVTALAPEGRTLSTTWEDLTPCGIFEPASPTGVTANWRATQEGHCSIRATVTDGTLSKITRIDFIVAPALTPGTVDVNVTFVHHPVALDIFIDDDCDIRETEEPICPSASIPNHSFFVQALFRSTEHTDESATFHVSCYDSESSLVTQQFFAGEILFERGEQVFTGLVNPANEQKFVTPDLINGFCVFRANYTQHGRTASIAAIRRILSRPGNT
jgi:hypothetical protein